MGGRLSTIPFVCRAGTAEERCLPADGGTTLRMCGADCGGTRSETEHLQVNDSQTVPDPTKPQQNA